MSLLAESARWHRAHGGAYDNTATFYRGDASINSEVARRAADPSAANALRASLGTSGLLRSPLLAVHSRAALLAPSWHTEAYRLKISAHGAASLLTVLSGERPGICDIEPALMRRAVSALSEQLVRRW